MGVNAMKKTAFLAVILLISTLGARADEPANTNAAATAQQPSTPPAPGTKTVKLCDNKTTVQVPNDAPKTRAEGQKISDELMAQWKETNPNSAWEQGEIEAHQVVAPADNTPLVGTGQSTTYGVITKQTVQVWKNETYKTALYGSKVFHSGDELGSEIGVSCDMCHPRAANTHPETYPKFQPQLGRVAMLRDMINWCIEHPVRGKVLAADDPKMRALEAYILAQRKGTPLDYGKR
jgi:thiosulfate dehydrogenase